jgi:hypothetical protein
MATEIGRWHGTDAEFVRLRQAIERNCLCPGLARPGDEAICPAHALLTRQSALDHLLYAYRARERFMDEERRPVIRRVGAHRDRPNGA